MENSKISLEHLKGLLEQEKFEEAKALLEKYFSQPLSEQERGQGYLEVAEIYLDIATHFGKQKKQLLETSLKALEDFDKKGRKLDDMINLQKIRDELK